MIGYVLTLLVLGALAYDAHAWWFYGAPQTLSHIALGVCQREPIVPFIAGLVIGHVLWSLK